MLRIAFLCSAGGGNMRFIHEAISLGWIAEAMVCGVIADRHCLASRFAQEKDVWSREVDFLEDGQTTLLNLLVHLRPDLIITTVNRILSRGVVDAFGSAMVNLHYSILPAFAGEIGTNPVKLALEYGAKFVGTTVHRVEPRVDSGRPIVQTAIPVLNEDSADSLMNVVFRSGCVALLNAIHCLRIDASTIGRESPSHLEICGRPVYINPMVVHDPGYQDELFWKRILSYQ